MVLAHPPSYAVVNTHPVTVTAEPKQKEAEAPSPRARRKDSGEAKAEPLESPLPSLNGGGENASGGVKYESGLRVGAKEAVDGGNVRVGSAVEESG
jgi:hypothetical protein